MARIIKSARITTGETGDYLGSMTDQPVLRRFAAIKSRKDEVLYAGYYLLDRRGAASLSLQLLRRMIELMDQ